MSHFRLMAVAFLVTGLVSACGPKKMLKKEPKYETVAPLKMKAEPTPTPKSGTKKKTTKKNSF